MQAKRKSSFLFIILTISCKSFTGQIQPVTIEDKIYQHAVDFVSVARNDDELIDLGLIKDKDTALRVERLSGKMRIKGAGREIIIKIIQGKKGIGYEAKIATRIPDGSIVVKKEFHVLSYKKELFLKKFKKILGE